MGRKLFRKFIVPPILFLFILLFSVAALYSVFDKVTQSIKDFFSFGDNDSIVANAEKLEEMVKNGYSFDNGYDEYLNNSNVSVYIDNEKKGYLENIPAKKIITVDGRTSYKDITMNLTEQKYLYSAPWQIFLLIDFISDSESFGDGVHENVNIAYEDFSPKYYGLRKSNGDFQFYAIKAVKKVYVTEEFENGNWIEVSRRTTETVEKTPLPYFTKIEAYDNTYEFEYEDKTTIKNTSNVVASTSTSRITCYTKTTDTIPTLKNNTVTSNADNFYTSICSIIGGRNIDTFVECSKYLPNDTRLSLLFSELSSKGYLSTAGIGTGAFIDINHDFNIPSIVSSNNKSISKGEFIGVATSLVGLNYQWGGKYHNVGVNPRWGDGVTGLDCSGFVDWVYTQFSVSVGTSTGSLFSNGKKGVLVPVSRSSLQIGDIGLDYTPGGGGNNHTGVVIGFADGQPLIAHAGGPYWGDRGYYKTGQVVISKLVSNYRNISKNTYQGYKPVTFSSFYRVQGLQFR